MSKLIEKVIYRGLSSVHSGGHAQSEAAQEAFQRMGRPALQQPQVMLTGWRRRRLIKYSHCDG